MPMAKIAASGPQLARSRIRATKSRRLFQCRSSNGIDNASATWVTQTNWTEFSRLAARKEKGSCVASRKAVEMAKRPPSR